MDKVIIDGVDISGCNMKCDNGDCALYYAELNNDNNELIYGFNCSDNQDCYYKQLKRKEQECEKLKWLIETKCESELDKENSELKAENERLKEELKKYEDMAKKGLEEFKDVGGCWGCGLQLQLNQDIEDIKQLKAKNFELKESLKCFQTPEAIKALTFYKTGEFELQEKKCIKLEQENEELKTLKDMYFTYYKAKHNDVKGEFFTIKKENERLKEEITKLSDPRYQISKVNEGYYNRMNTYKQALQEIKDIVSEPCIVDENCQTCNSGCMQKDILAKINEVIGVEE